ncbi:hypothetical protein P4B35_19085 [Pontiellaceae bacterium B12227]|nr:hypothetical protein [Pontiellaceae bacterium B12227]
MNRDLLTFIFIPALAAIPLSHGSEVESQYRNLEFDLARTAHFERVSGETFHPQALVTKADRDPLNILLRRTRALLDDIAHMSGAPEMGAFERRLSNLEKAEGDRRELFSQAHALRREIAFSNPLLNFDKLLFIKRHRSNFSHMCDQFYGAHARPGGSVYVLDNPFSDAPVVTDLLKGQGLAGGSFLSPELSFDGRQVLFAYTECTGDKKHIVHLDHERGHWNVGRSYHLYSADLNAAGKTSGVRKLTDGTFNDFDPCFLPNGRVAFISERRGGYLRCGRDCPSYTVHDMNPDGSDIRILSPHENNEWQPSVLHDGMLAYTRWDYVDRHGCVAHHPWIMTPDGRDSRAVHGNFSVKAQRADMEMDLRAVPGSHKIVGTAAPHHGQAYGSIIIVDPRTPDDDAMAPVKRLTPDVAFPESQKGKQVYGTPWPLSEKYHLVVYDAKMQQRNGRQGDKTNPRGEYGIYLLDAFGNKILIYRDPEIACLSPIPLRPRPMPPVLPERSNRLEKHPKMEGTMAVLNIYDSLMPWPENTRITALRIYQIHPSSTPSGPRPHETGKRIAEAGDSVNLTRRIIGTVPVESDGSAFFKVPALKELYFQALDEGGLAVQSMRSSTWVQPGEQLICMGCHEPKNRAPLQPQKTALALQRKPSVPQADVDGTNPFSYPRLVQPVLDKHCVSCHDNTHALPLDRQIVQANLGKGKTSVFRSYDSLIHEYGFWKFGDHYRTIPGEFGARASKLYKMLKAGHSDVKLSDEELHRITVWLDSMSNFYGVYEKEGGLAQLRGEIVEPTLE